MVGYNWTKQSHICLIYPLHLYNIILLILRLFNDAEFMEYIMEWNEICQMWLSIENVHNNLSKKVKEKYLATALNAITTFGNY